MASALPGTIVAIASPRGSTGRAIVRMSGGATRAALEACCVGLTLPPGRASVRTTLGIGAPLPVLLLWFPSPRSYSGEESAEVLCVGGEHVPGRVVRALLSAHEAVRLAEPGEFTARAFLNGRLSVEESEGVQALIGARSDEERLSAQRLVSGETGGVYRSLADDLSATLALVEAGIDFVEEEDVVAISEDDRRARVGAMLGVIDGLLGGAPACEARSGRAMVVIAGAPSAGKSTLFNRLLGRERAVVDEAPGTTRDRLVERCTPDGRADVDLCDVAGLDEALAGRSVADAGAQERARAALGEADVVVWCDPAGSFEGGGLDLRPWTTGATLLRVRTKGDLAREREHAGLSVCALDGAGIDALQRAIADTCAESGGGAAVARHAHALRETRSALAESQELTEAEEVAGTLRLALDALAPIAGRVHPDDVIGRIFATFCVGK